MDRNTWYVSEQWLRIFAYERGKEGDAETVSELQRHLRLAEARATLRDGREWHTKSSAPDDIPH